MPESDELSGRAAPDAVNVQSGPMRTRLVSANRFRAQANVNLVMLAAVLDHRSASASPRASGTDTGATPPGSVKGSASSRSARNVRTGVDPSSGLKRVYAHRRTLRAVGVKRSSGPK